MAHGDGSFASRLAQLAKLDLLILDFRHRMERLINVESLSAVNGIRTQAIIPPRTISGQRAVNRAEIVPKVPFKRQKM